MSQFILEKECALTEIQAKLKLLRHEPTGARVLHLETDDDENAFCVSFRTYPDSNNGVAHILEHTVLCGSKRFPVKDPFFLMNRRSLNTFMNAFTGGDFTCYPAATQNKEDFYNLLDVYIDATFFPNLNRLSFLQEGHRVEFEKSDDASTPLQFKGIVFNEMKGSYASPDRRFHEVMNEKLFPTLTYGKDSGGKPEAIPSLTYTELLSFHDTYYHPSHALFYFYGNLPLEEHLRFLEEKLLSKATPRIPLPPLPRETRYTVPQRFEATFPIGKDEEANGKTRVGIGWLTTEASDQLTSLALTILLITLLDTDASPLKKALLALKEVKQVSSSIDTDCAEVPVLIVFNGCEEADAPKIEKETLRLLKEIAAKPIDHALLESALHQMAIHRSEINGDDLPWGLNLFMRSGLILQQGGDPEEALRIHTLFQKLRDNWEKDPLYFNKLLETWFINNPHRVTLSLVPDKNLADLEEEKEKALLEQIKTKLTGDSVQIILNDAEALHYLQEDEDGSEEVLPKIPLSAIPKEPKDYPLSHETIGNLEMYHHDTFTNGLVYADLVLPLPHLKEEELPFLRLLTTFLTELGAGGKGYEETLHEVQAKTGGIYASVGLYTPIDTPKECSPSFILSGKALDADVESLFKLMGDFIHSPDFTDDRRLLELWEKHTSSTLTSLPSKAMRYASLLAAASFGETPYLSEKLFGLDYVWTLLGWKKQDLLTHIREGIQQLTERLFSQKGDLVITAPLAIYKTIRDQKVFGLCAGKRNHHPSLKISPKKEDFVSQGRSFASPVAFISQIVPSVSFTHPDAPALSLASFILDNQTLHTEIRERGGAYGAGSKQQSSGGLFSFYSYRDPHVGESLTIFQQSLEALVKDGVEESEREEALLEMVQGLDSPLSPGGRGMTAYTWLREGKTFEKRRDYRERLLKTSAEEIIKSVEKHLLPSYSKAVTVITAGEELLEAENARRKKLGLSPLPINPLEKKVG